MASKYWIKLYHEILDDPKMMKMSEVLFARCVKLFLLAGDQGDDGELPDPEEAAWRLRITSEEMESDYIELQKLGILGQTDGQWFVTKWEERQGPMSASERARRYRKSQQSLEYQRRGPADVAFGRDNPNDEETDTERNVCRGEEKRIDKDEESASIPVFYEQVTGTMLTPTQWEILGDYIDERGEAFVVDAIETAAGASDRPNFNYIKAILNRRIADQELEEQKAQLYRTVDA